MAQQEEEEQTRELDLSERGGPGCSLHAQVRMLTAQQEEQMKELERQQVLAQLQYNQVLEQYLRHSTGHTSQQQQQMLQSVLADPNLVNILKSVLLSGQGGEGGGVSMVKEEGVGLEESDVLADTSNPGFLYTGTAGRFPMGEEFQLTTPSPAQVKPLQQVVPPPQAKPLQVAPPQAKPLQVAPPQATPLQATPPQAKPLQVAPPQAKSIQGQQSALVQTSSASNLAHLVCPTQLAKVNVSVKMQCV